MKKINLILVVLFLAVLSLLITTQAKEIKQLGRCKKTFLIGPHNRKLEAWGSVRHDFTDQEREGHKRDFEGLYDKSKDYFRTGEPSPREICGGLVFRRLWDIKYELCIDAKNFYKKIIDTYGKEITKLENRRNKDIIVYYYDDGSVAHVAVFYRPYQRYLKKLGQFEFFTKDQWGSTFKARLPHKDDLYYDNKKGWTLSSDDLRKREPLLSNYPYFKIFRIDDLQSIKPREVNSGPCDEEYAKEIDGLIEDARKAIENCKLDDIGRILEPIIKVPEEELIVRNRPDAKNVAKSIINKANKLKKELETAENEIRKIENDYHKKDSDLTEMAFEAQEKVLGLGNRVEQAITNAENIIKGIEHKDTPTNLCQQAKEWIVKLNLAVENANKILTEVKGYYNMADEASKKACELSDQIHRARVGDDINELRNQIQFKTNEAKGAAEKAQKKAHDWNLKKYIENAETADKNLKNLRKEIDSIKETYAETKKVLNDGFVLADPELLNAIDEFAAVWRSIKMNRIKTIYAVNNTLKPLSRCMSTDIWTNFTKFTNQFIPSLIKLRDQAQEMERKIIEEEIPEATEKIEKIKGMIHTISREEEALDQCKLEEPEDFNKAVEAAKDAEILAQEASDAYSAAVSCLQKISYRSPDGLWRETDHVHSGCKVKRDFCRAYKVNIDFSFSPDGTLVGITSSADGKGNGSLTLKGKLIGYLYKFDGYMGGRHHGKGEFEFGSDFKSFEGRFIDNWDHRVEWKGRRE